MDPNPPQPDEDSGWGKGTGGKKTFLGAWVGGPSASPRLGWPCGPRRRKRSGPPPPLFPRRQGSFAATARPHTPATWAQTGRAERPGGDGAGRAAAGEEAADAS